MLNSDAEIYGGSNIGNAGGMNTEAKESHGFKQSLLLTLPPLGMVMMKPQ
jgi:1,4-alpha-glucan branching enzyme